MSPCVPDPEVHVLCKCCWDVDLGKRGCMIDGEWYCLPCCIKMIDKRSEK